MTSTDQAPAPSPKPDADAGGDPASFDADADATPPFRGDGQAEVTTATSAPAPPRPDPPRRSHDGHSVRSRHGAAGGPGGWRRDTLLAVGALGIVYGDIGTSPLYALRECFAGPHAVQMDRVSILGALSLVFWALLTVITVKYLLYVMRADNEGEGGILALMALAKPDHARAARHGSVIVIAGLFGAALLYGDAMITPAISVLSAIEGLKIATTATQPFVIPITIGILVALFSVQHRGTARIGAVFGPVTLIWFAVLGLLGVRGILLEPAVLEALSPVYAVGFFTHNGWHGTAVLGAVFLVVTGGEALYADMGHFGSRPIRQAWFAVVLPGLVLNYFGQGALLVHHPDMIQNPFFLLAPSWALYPLVALATLATIIASQAVISGVFSLTSQAVNLGYAARLRIDHTSEEEVGQVYVPAVNWAVMIATCLLVIGFGSSSALAGAYGVAVSTTMVVTTALAFVVAWRLWKWNLWVVGGITVSFLLVDIAFLGANLAKVAEGGWFPLLMGGAVYLLMATWRRGRDILGVRLRKSTPHLRAFLDRLEKEKPVRVPGTAIYMSGNPNGTPPALAHNLKHNHVVHENVVILRVRVRDVPVAHEDERIVVSGLRPSIHRVELTFGFRESPNVPRALAEVAGRFPELGLDIERASYFLGSERLVPNPKRGMPAWRDALFAFMARNARQATAFFHIPNGRVVELGSRIKL